MHSKPDRFLSIAQVAEMTGLKVGTIYNGHAGTSELPKIKLGSRVVFSLEAVEKWMTDRAMQTQDAARRRKQRMDAFLAAFHQGGEK